MFLDFLYSGNEHWKKWNAIAQDNSLTTTFIEVVTGHNLKEKRN